MELASSSIEIPTASMICKETSEPRIEGVLRVILYRFLYTQEYLGCNCKRKVNRRFIEETNENGPQRSNVIVKETDRKKL